MKSLFRGIGWRIFLSFSTLLIVLVIVINVLGLKFAQKMATDNAANELRVLTVTLNNQIQKYLRKIETDLKIFSAGNGILDQELKKSRPNTAKMVNFLDAKRNQNTNFEDLAVFDVTGRCIAATDENWIGLSAHREPFFINGLKRYGFAEIFESKNQEKILLVSTPINEGMDPHGVLVGQIKLSALYDLMGQKLGVKGNTEPYLIDSKLRFITTDKGSEEVMRESRFLSSPLIQHLQDEFWVGQYLNRKNVEVLGTVSKLQGRQWYLVLEKDFSQVESELNEIKNALFTATVLLLIALILVTVVLAHSITRPLQALVSGAQKIAGGDFSSPFNVPSGLDEITFLSQEFEKMRARVAVSQGRLIEQLAESEQRRLENERLVAIGTLASSLAHEIRNPLNALSLFLSHLERSQSSDPSKAKIFDSMRAEIARLDRLVSDILDYSKPLQLDLSKIQIHKFLEEIFEFYKPTFEKNGIKLTMNSGIEYNVRGDASRLKQAFVNLIQNAIDALEGERGEIHVDFQKKDRFLEIIMKDSGRGISEGTQRRLFDLFFTTKERGTGLGLSIVRKIIDAHGGSIFLEKAPVRGTLVHVALPLDSQS